MTNNVCPHCGNVGPTAILRPHWSKQYLEFICGDCKLEIEFRSDPSVKTETQLPAVYKSFLKFEVLEQMEGIKNKVSEMNEKEMISRLLELAKKKNGVDF